MSEKLAIVLLMAGAFGLLIWLLFRDPPERIEPKEPGGEGWDDGD